MIKECPECKKIERIHARGVCMSCYHKQMYKLKKEGFKGMIGRPRKK